MQRNVRSLMATALLAGLAMPAVGGGVEVLPRGFGGLVPTLDPRRSAFRQGRRFRNGSRVKVGGNPAGTKLARKAAKGTLTIVGIR